MVIINWVEMEYGALPPGLPEGLPPGLPPGLPEGLPPKLSKSLRNTNRLPAAEPQRHALVSLRFTQTHTHQHRQML